MLNLLYFLIPSAMHMYDLEAESITSMLSLVLNHNAERRMQEVAGLVVALGAAGSSLSVVNLLGAFVSVCEVELCAVWWGRAASSADDMMREREGNGARVV